MPISLNINSKLPHRGLRPSQQWVFTGDIVPTVNSDLSNAPQSESQRAGDCCDCCAITVAPVAHFRGVLVLWFIRITAGR